MFKPFTDQQQKFAEHLAKTSLPVSSPYIFRLGCKRISRRAV